MEQETRIISDVQYSGNQIDEPWYTDNESGSDEELNKKVDSSDERAEDIHHGYIEFKEKNYPDKKGF